MQDRAGCGVLRRTPRHDRLPVGGAGVVRAVLVVAATPARSPQLVFLGLPVAEAPPGHGFQEGPDAVGRDAHQPGSEDREQV